MLLVYTNVSRNYKHKHIRERDIMKKKGRGRWGLFDFKFAIRVVKEHKHHSSSFF